MPCRLVGNATKSRLQSTPTPSGRMSSTSSVFLPGAGQ
uniref:Uncharacterized protein n=1 Tax=Arundo donax TaxID=35708 RepID=A0A0A8YGH8_ARUDO